LQKQYHVNRIATIIGKGIWREPLLLYVDRKSILDGGHRLWALCYLDKKEVEVIVIERNSLTGSEVDALWQAIAQCCGDSRRALEYLKIGIIEE
jgi:ParB-like chromosome segregation protein Spo0J